MQTKAVRNRKRLFDWIRYRAPKPLSAKRPLVNVIGLDTEAYTTGRPFMFATADTVWNAEQWPECIFSRRYRGQDFGVWNLKYDSGAILYHLPAAARRQLRLKGRAQHDGVRYRWIPGKLLRMTRGGHGVRFWDIMPFYGGGLHKNATKWLGWSIKDVADKAHTPDTARANWLPISAGCMQSAKATGELAALLLKRLKTLDLEPSALYSMATISQRHFRENAPTIDVERFWRSGRRLLYFAMEAYHGGKFEVLRRGAFSGYLYDINSAYASVIRDLVDIRGCQVMADSHYHDDATYAFLHVAAFIEGDIPHPLAVLRGNVKVYPQGRVVTYCTKGEYDYLVRHGVNVVILDALWIYPKTDSRPYRAVVDNMTALKHQYKDSDPILSKMAKGVNNSFYGKWLQLTPEGDDNVRAGQVWNPIYAALTTAAIRLQVCEAQQLLGSAVLALHADSILTTKPLPANLVGPEDGKWELKRQGDGVVVGNGIYQIADKVAFRGFDLRDGTRWTDVLAKMGDADSAALPHRRVMSWVQADAQDRQDDINKFIDHNRRINLNADRKRIWLKPATGRRLLAGLQDSFPVFNV